MHTIDELAGTDFEYRVAGESVSRRRVMPPITPHDRVGVVMATGTDGLGAGSFILSCVVAFYERLARTTEEFFEYPDYYTFQTTEDPATYSMFDIYPEHKNVGVEPTGESLLRAINDRAITVLLVPDTTPTPPAIEDITRRSGDRRIESCYVYAPDGQPHEADFSIRHPRDPAAEWYETIAHTTDSGTAPDSLPSVDSSEEHLHQQFREVSLEDALARLPTA